MTSKKIEANLGDICYRHIAGDFFFGTDFYGDFIIIVDRKNKHFQRYAISVESAGEKKSEGVVKKKTRSIQRADHIFTKNKEKLKNVPIVREIKGNETKRLGTYLRPELLLRFMYVGSHTLHV